MKVLILFLMVPNCSYAYDFESGGIYYNYLGENNVSVTSGDTKYQGNIVIPSKVTYNSKTYSVTSIGKDSFKECSSLTSISIPNSVITIGEDAFYYCTGLSTVTIPNSVTSIDDGAFYNCQKFTHITIPNSVTHIGYYVFSGCDLSSIKVESGNMYYDSRNDCNAIIETSSNTLITGLINTVIPNSVTAIGQHAFHACHDLTSVTIPKNIKSIGSRAFSWCNSLTSIKVESGNPQYDSRNNCNAIIETSSNTLIAGCKKTTIPNNVISIGSYAFHGCPGLASIDIPNSVTNIGYSAFFSCKDLTSITILNSAVSIEPDAFKGTAWYNNQPDGLVYIGKIAYNYKGEMPANTNVTIKNGTLGIANSAFKNCSALISVTIPNSVISIGNNAFENCYALTSVIIPNSVTSIGIKAFQYCTSVTYLSIPNSVTSIGHGAFYGCSGINTVTIPNSVTHFGNFVFGGCSNLSSIKVESGNIYYDSRDNCNAVIETSSNTLITGLYNTVIPNSVTAIGDYAFYDCSNLVTTIIPQSVKSIGKGAFSYCKNLISVISKIEKPFVIDNTVFENVWRVQLIVPKGTKSAYQATEGWSLFNIILEGDGVIGYVFNNDGLNYCIGENNTVSVVGPRDYSGDIVIPNQVVFNGIAYSVTSIGEYAFGYAKTAFSSISVTIPNTITSIGGGAFQESLGLKAVYITDLEAWCKICFGGDESNPLQYAHHLYLNGIEIKDLVIPNSVTSVNSCAFWGCSGLTSVTIPNNITTIGSLAFYGCSSLTSITIPNSVTSISYSTFCNCSSLSTIVSEIENPFAIEASVFYSYDKDIYASATLIVPKGTKAAYQATEGWNLFTKIVEAGDAESDHSGQIYANGIYYKVTESEEVEVMSAADGTTSITIPSTISYNNTSYKVTAIAKDAFEDCEHLAAVTWEPEVQFNAKVNNPNFLLYVSDERYASRSIKNVVVNGVAESIELADAANGNDFYCPRAFRARSIVYSHNYQMETGIGDSRGWETIVLPFDVQKYTHATKSELESFTTWTKGSNKKPFWLFELTTDGYKDAAGIKANTPHIISMPNNKQYEQQYQLSGIVTFSATDVEVQSSDNLKSVTYQGRTFVPNYTNKSGDDCLALNVNSYYVTNPGTDIDGSKFIRGLRAVHPFEAYMTTTDNTRAINVMDGMPTAIRGIRMASYESSDMKVYDTRGVLLKTATNMDDVRNGLKAGVYIVNGKKVIIK